jgi:two-component system phosphate regulon sensor histidine kinase PhoR
VIVIGLWMMSRAVRREVEIAQLKSDFVANVSHELRTPLSAISYIVELLDRGRFRTAEEIKDSYGMLREETRRLQELIEDVLNFSKAIGGKKVYHREPLALEGAVREAIGRLRGKAEAAGFHIAFEAPAEPLWVLGDPRAVVHALANLIDNAMKYSGDAREVRVALRSEGGSVLAEVTDQGLGIAESEQARIFEKFYRVERGAAKDVQGGVGLGLAMVQHIMQSHEGSVEVRSQMGKGSVFTLRFPRLEKAGEAA